MSSDPSASSPNAAASPTAAAAPSAPTMAAPAPASATPGSSLFDSRARDISNSPAFTYLDSLYRAGALTATQLEQYKSRYSRLHEAVINTYTNEKLLLDRAKELKNQLESERIKLEQKTILSHDTVADLEQLAKEEKDQKTLLAHLTDEKQQIQYELDELNHSRKEQKETLELKFKASLSQLEPVVHGLTTKIEELKTEIEQQQTLYEKEAQATTDYNAKQEEIHAHISLLEKEKIKKRALFQQSSSEPERMRTNIAMIENVLKEMEEENDKLNTDINHRESELNTVNEERRTSNLAIEELGMKLENFRLAIAKRKSNLEEIKRVREMEEQKKDMTAEKRSTIELSKLEEKENSRQFFSSMNEFIKAIEIQKKIYEKMRRKKETIVSVQQPLKEQLNEARAQYHALEAQYIQQKAMLVEIKADEELFISQYLAQEKLEDDTGEVLAAVIKDQKEYEEKIKILDKEEKDLQLFINSLSASRELMSREASKATGAYRETKEELKIKNLILMDLDKQTMETFNKLKSCSSKYEKMKNQRNKLANLTQASSQAIAEMKEKIKILHNEVDILRNELLSKDRSYAEEVRQHVSNQNHRDGLRVEQNKYIHDLRIKKDEESQQMMEIIKLNSIINNAEQQMMSLRKDYAAAVDNRNLTGIQLIDRNDELCILYEKANIEKNILKHGDEELNQREEEIQVLEREIADIKRRVEIARKRIPSIDVYAATTRTLRALESQLDDERRLVGELCGQLETPSRMAANANNEEIQQLLNNATGAVAGQAAGAGGEEMKKQTNNNASTMNATSSAAAHSLSLLHGTDDPRCRRLGGVDPEPEQLAAKIEVLEERLNEKKEQLLEKELVLDEVASLSDKLRLQAAESRPASLDAAKKNNDVQGRLRAIGKKMMAAVSELALYQANCMKLEAEKSEQERLYREARERLEAGQPPTEEAEYEWYRLERERVRRQELLMAGLQRREADLFEAEANSVVRSTAEARPNAYIPEEFGLPKPYSGQLAPFKPSNPSNGLGQLRHFRRPQTREIIL